jgi:hypothetical protein
MQRQHLGKARWHWLIGCQAVIATTIEKNAFGGPIKEIGPIEIPPLDSPHVGSTLYQEFK